MFGLVATVSATFGKSKTSFLELVNESGESPSISDIWADKDYIGLLSTDVFRIMYSGKKT